MTHHDASDRDLVVWFSDDATRRAPARLLEAIAADTRARPQLPGWLATLRGDSLGTTAGSTRTRKLTLALVVIAVLALIAAIVASGQKREPHAGLLAFVRDGDVYLAGPDGSDARLVLREDGVAFSTVAWSATGRLALDSDAGAVILDVQTGDTTLVGGHSPTWSPDGLRLAVLIDYGGTALAPSTMGVRIVDATTLSTVATLGFEAIGGLSWSPNGRWIAATGGEGSKSVIRIDVSTGEVVQIEGPSGHLDSAKEVAWAPDSRHVAFIRYGDGAQSTSGGTRCSDSLACRVDVIVAEADGSNAHVLNQDAENADQPSWSPDGQWIAFRDVSGNSLGTLGLRVVRADGTGERTLVTAKVRGFTWSPESERVLYTVADLPSGPAAVWATSLSGVAQNLGIAIDTGSTPFSSTGLAFALRAASAASDVATMPSVDAPRPVATPQIATPPAAGPADPSAFWSAILTDQAFGCQPTAISTTSWLPIAITDLCDPGAESDESYSGGWSPNGSSYAYVHGPAFSPSKLLIARPDGSIVFEHSLPSTSMWGGWAPDGSRLGFTVGGDLSFVAKDPAGSWSVTDVQVDDTIAMTWSPDGQWLAVLRSDGNLLIGGQDGTDLRVVGAYPLPDAWAPDGWPIAFVRDGDVWLVDGIGLAPRNVSQLPLGGAVGAAWAPDGTRIVVATGSGLLLMAPDGSDRRWLDLGVDQTGGATWAPDSARFVADLWGSTGGILIVSVDGSPSIRVDGVYSPIWSPDGRFLLVSDSNTGKLAILNADGSGRRDLVTAEVVSGSPAWAR